MPNGYGKRGKNGVTWLAHRLAWFEANGPIPEGMHVCHRCDNRKCVNVDHLFLGTRFDNMRDMIAKGRAKFVGFKSPNFNGPNRIRRGSDKPNAVLDEAKVAEIRALPASTYIKHIAAAYGVSMATVQRIRAGTTWRHVAC